MYVQYHYLKISVPNNNSAEEYEAQCQFFDHQREIISSANDQRLLWGRLPITYHHGGVSPLASMSLFYKMSEQDRTGT